MSRSRYIGAVVIFALAVGLTVLTAAVLHRDLRVEVEEQDSAILLHGEHLSSTQEERTVGLDTWLRHSLHQPAAFAATVRWCQDRQRLPLPNCRNVLIVAEATAAVEFASGDVSHAE